MLRVRDQDPAHQHYFDIEKVSTVPELFAEIGTELARFPSKVKSALASILHIALNRVESIEVAAIAVRLREALGLAPDWRPAADQLFGPLSSEEVLILDEFPVFLKQVLDRDAAEGTSEGLGLLHWLRDQRQQGRGPTVVYAGSTGLIEVVRATGYPAAINDLSVVKIPRLTEPDASALVHAVAATEGLHLTKQGVAAAIDQVGSEVPAFLHLLLRAIRKEQRDGRWPRTAQGQRTRLPEIYQDQLLGPESRLRMESFYQRLGDYYTPDEREAALVILGALSKTRHGHTKGHLRSLVAGRGLNPNLVDRILPLLASDYYLEEVPKGRWRFGNRYMADWWCRFHA